MKAYIELYGEETGSGRRPKGDPDISILEPGNCQAICHNHSGGKIVSTIFKVDISSSEIDRIVSAHADHSRFDTDEDVQWRGLEIRPGTSTNTEVDDLKTRLQNWVGMDISRSDPPRGPPKGTPPSWTNYLKNHTKDIGVGLWLCKHLDHTSPERAKMGEECSLGHEETNKYAQPNVPTFDITRW